MKLWVNNSFIANGQRPLYEMVTYEFGFLLQSDCLISALYDMAILACVFPAIVSYKRLAGFALFDVNSQILRKDAF